MGYSRRTLRRMRDELEVQIRTLTQMQAELDYALGDDFRKPHHDALNLPDLALMVSQLVEATLLLLERSTPR